MLPKGYADAAAVAVTAVTLILYVCIKTMARIGFIGCNQTYRLLFS